MPGFENLGTTILQSVAVKTIVTPVLTSGVLIRVTRCDSVFASDSGIPAIGPKYGSRI